MADTFSLTNRFKYPVPTLNSTNWMDLLTHWAELNDVMFTVLSNRNYVISGLDVTTSSTSLDFSYVSGVVSINGSAVSISSGNGSLIADTFNWIYVQGGVIKISTYPPSGVPYVSLACVQTDSTGTVGHADLRPSPPVLNGVSITPSQVNPTSDINLLAGKRFRQADNNVGSNIFLFSDAQIVTIINWGNQTVAKTWQDVDLSTYLPATAKFAILDLRISTLSANVEGWVILEVKTNSTDTDYMYFVRDYGHPNAAPLNSKVWGPSEQVILAVDSDNKFRVRTVISSLGLGTYYAFIQLKGYVE